VPPAPSSSNISSGEVKESPASPEQVTMKSEEQHCRSGNDTDAAAARVPALNADPESNDLTDDSIMSCSNVNQESAPGGSRVIQNVSLANSINSGAGGKQTYGKVEPINVAEKPAAGISNSRIAEGMDSSSNPEGEGGGEAGASHHEVRVELSEAVGAAPETPRSQQKRLFQLGKLLLQPSRLVNRSVASAQGTDAGDSEQGQPVFQLTPRRNSPGLLQHSELHEHDKNNGKSTSFMSGKSVGNSFLQRIQGKVRQQPEMHEQQQQQQQQQPQLGAHLGFGEKGPDAQHAASVTEAASVLSAFQRRSPAEAVATSKGVAVVGSAAVAGTRETAADKSMPPDTECDVPADTGAETSAGSMGCLAQPEAADVADVPAAGHGKSTPGDQRGKSSRPSMFVSRMISFRSTTSRDSQEQGAAEPQTAAPGELLDLVLVRITCCWKDDGR